MALGVVTGIGIGITFGVEMDNIGAGITIGVGI